MQTLLQVALGTSPLIIASIICLIKKKMKVFPIAMLLCSAAVLVYGAFSWKDTEAKKVTKQQQTSEENYLYLAGNSILQKKYEDATGYLSDMNAVVGDNPQATLYYARLSAAKGDYDGAYALYKKLDMLGKLDSIGTADDKTLMAKIESGEAINKFKAASELAVIKSLKAEGKDITEYGYTEEKTALLESAATDSVDFTEGIRNALENELDELFSSKEEYFENLEDAYECIDIVNSSYVNYKNSKGYDEEALKEAYNKLIDAFEDAPEIFYVTELDETFVKAAVLQEEYEDLGTYADRIESQKALVTVAQLLIDDVMKERDLPEGFVSITEEQLDVIAEQCEEALENVAENSDIEGQAFDKLEHAVESIGDMADYLALVEVNSRLTPEEQNLEKQSEIYFGSSAIDYAMGNTDAGDKDFNSSVETAPYSSNKAFSNAMNEVSKVINDVSEESDVKSVSSYISEAYKQGVINRNYTPNNSNANKPDGEKQTSSLEMLTSQGTTCVSKKMAMTNISAINISKFPEVSFNIQTAEALDLNNHNLMLNDCGSNIKDFKIEKVKAEECKIYIVCDKSGSMSGSEATLKEAVRSFASSITKKEKVAVVGFSSNVEFASELTNNPSELEEYIEKLNASGGTNIASGAFYALDKIGTGDGSFNIVVVITDGNDSSFNDARLKELAQKCNDTNTVLYTIGLGSSVKPDYLEKVADYGNGKFVYCYNVNELEGLYGFIHGQIENNYKVTFTAIDTATNYRTLTVTDLNTNTSAKKDYTLGKEESTPGGNTVVYDGKVSINGFANKKIYKTDTDVTVDITGTGFESDMECTVSIKGDAYKGIFTGKYVSETLYTVTIPKQVPAGTYTAVISIDGYAISDSVEILIPGELHSITFGAYTFTAMNIVKENNVVTLSGDVAMNDFIHFNGTITLKGNVDKDTKITLVDKSGSYISFTKNLPGVLGVCFGNNLPIIALGNLTLYNDQANISSLDNYMVDKLVIPTLKYGAIFVEGPTIAVYPHKINMQLSKVGLELPFQEQIFETMGSDSPFVGTTANAGGFINNSGLYVYGSFNSGELFKSFKYSKFDFSIGELECSFDTYNHDYFLKLIVGSNIIPKKLENKVEEKSSGYGFDISVKGGKWDALTLYADLPIIVVPMPTVTLSGFFVGISGLAVQEQDGKIGQLIRQATLSGGCDISLFKLKDIVPAVGSIFGDLALISLDQTTVKLSLGSGLQVTSTAKLLGEVECGSIDLALGKYNYQAFVLDIAENDVIGLYADLKQGPKLDFPNFYVLVQGNSRVSINHKLAAVSSGGDVEYDIKFLFFNFQDKMNARYEMVFTFDRGMFLAVKGTAIQANKNAGFMICINGWDSYFELY